MGLSQKLTAFGFDVIVVIQTTAVAEGDPVPEFLTRAAFVTWMRSLKR